MKNKDLTKPRYYVGIWQFCLDFLVFSFSDKKKILLKNGLF